jgi:hypothetical protein
MRMTRRKRNLKNGAQRHEVGECGQSFAGSA